MMFLLGFTMLLSQFVEAEVPKVMSYQGRLSDTTGTPLSGDYNLLFSIYNQESGGNPLWQEQHSDLNGNSVQVESGLFVALLGEVSLIPDSVLSASELWLAIKIGSDPEMQPRTRLTSSFYSFGSIMSDSALIASSAHSSDNLAGNPPSFYLDWNNLIDIPAGFADGVDDDAGGDITEVAAGTGLAGGGEVGWVSLSVAPEGITNVEIADEPGIAYEFDGINSNIASTITAYDSVTITLPGNGYVVATALAQVNLRHYSDSEETVRMCITRDSVYLDYGSSGLWRFDRYAPSLTIGMIHQLSATKVESLAAGTYKYYLNAEATETSSPADAQLVRRHLTVMYFPTAYGTVTSKAASSGDVQTDRGYE